MQLQFKPLLSNSTPSFFFWYLGFEPQTLHILCIVSVN
uniref:Uncharacterized protein n=1 Tax=Medicago truncatula TaxID=3880 RepID=I3T2J1_MEDTR|nr:unknown [Medicago truncatula]